jgi:hypothetical protein
MESAQPWAIAAHQPRTTMEWRWISWFGTMPEKRFIAYSGSTHLRE